MPRIQSVKDRRLGTSVLNQGNQSRNGFLHNCYTTAMGRFFQETIKRWLETGIARIHNKEIPKYDKDAYTFDDPRLKLLHDTLLTLIERYLNDCDKDRKRELVRDISEIWLFMMKEDIYWRRVGVPLLVDLAHVIVENEHLFVLTPEEEQNLVRFK
jgi:hypothetical protein